MKLVLISAAAALGIAASAANAVEANDTAARPVVKRHQANTKKVAHRSVKPRAEQYQAVVAPEPSAPVYLPQPLVPLANYLSTIPFPAKDGSLTYRGVTVYGGVDMGLGYQTHGAPVSAFYGSARNYTPNAANTHTQVGIMPNSLSSSNLGVKGVEEITPGLSFVFNYQLQFMPNSLQLQNGNKSQVVNNGVPVGQRTSAGDSSKDGQVDTSLLYGGLSSPTFGTLTFGRQYSLGLDAVIAYDPMSASNAFSLIGFAGMTAGGGNTEDARQGDMLKYRVNFGPFRGAATYKFDDFGESRRNAYGAQFGGEYGGFSGDVIYTVVHDSIGDASLGVGVPQLITAPNTLMGTISDNYAVMAVASYKYDNFKFYAGYENIRFTNPSNGGLPNGAQGLGYNLVISPMMGSGNLAFTVNRKVDVFWGGVKYSVTPKLDLIGAYYHYTQNNYSSTPASVAGCAANSRFATTCAGTQDAGSVLVDYKISKNFDIYAGAMYGIVHGGFAGGYYSSVVPPNGSATNGTTTGTATNTIDPMVGARFQF